MERAEQAQPKPAEPINAEEDPSYWRNDNHIGDLRDGDGSPDTKGDGQSRSAAAQDVPTETGAPERKKKSRKHKEAEEDIKDTQSTAKADAKIMASEGKLRDP